jgi:sirohydrochlorin cobaltochelatase
MSTDNSQGVVLFGHGARDPRWAEPFEQLAEVLRRQRIAGGDTGPVTLAFLELMQPDLPSAIAAQANAGCDVVTVVPVFFGRGSHLREDLPALLASCRAAHPALEIRCTTAVGEDPTVQAAIARFCLTQIGA